MAEVSPSILHEQGLVAGIRALATQMKRHELEVRVEIDSMDECCLPISCTVLLFRSVRELLINTAKHAAVKQATVRLTCEQGLLQIVVRDESGFDLAASQGPPPPGTENVLSSKIGLLTIRERMKAMNGRFDLASAPKQGTTATLTLPIEPLRHHNSLCLNQSKAFSHHFSSQAATTLLPGQDNSAPSGPMS